MRMDEEQDNRENNEGIANSIMSIDPFTLVVIHFQPVQ